MKINLGCGHTYKKGYINVDAYNDTVADRIMLAHKLEFGDNAASRIECIQMIEHLGAVKSIYAISEMFRVLKPQGLLLLETPDIEKAFQRFLKRGEEDRKYLMNWIFGLDSPGMLHRYCYPRELLTRMLNEAGFVNVKTDRINTKTNQPTLRAICRKPDRYMIHQTISSMRQKLVELGVVDLDNQVKSMEQEKLIQEIKKLINQYDSNSEDKNLRSLVIESAITCPDVGLFFLNEARTYKIVRNEAANPLIDILRFFSDLKFPTVLLYLLRNAPLEIGSQEQTYSSIRAIAVKAVEKALSGKSEEVFKKLRITKKEIKSHLDFNIFSMVEIQQLAERTLALAAKAFAENKLSEAIEFYNKALSLDRNNLKAVWNIARIEGLRGSQKNSENYYEQARNLAGFFKLPIQRYIVNRLNSEMQQLSNNEMKQLSEPLIDIV